MVKEWDSVHKMIKYYMEKYGHLLHPPRDFNDLVSQYKKIQEIDKEDGDVFLLHTWKLLEDYPNKFIMSFRPAGNLLLHRALMDQKQGGKLIRGELFDVFYEFPKVIAPKEKIEVPKIPEVKEEERIILISEIFIPPNYPRKYVDPNHVNDIAKSIKIDGQTDPIVVVPKEYAKYLEKQYPELKKYNYVLIKGLNRIKAMQSINSFRIRALIRHNDYKEERMKAFHENILLKKLSPYELALEIDLYRKEGMTQEQIAEKYGLSHQHISRLLSFADANFKSDFGDKEVALTSLSYSALAELRELRNFWLIDKKGEKGREYEFIKSKIIEEFEKGNRDIGIEEIRKWKGDFFYKKYEEKYGKDVVQVLRLSEEETIEEAKAQQVQVQIQKPIEKPIEERVPTREEMKEEKRKEVKKKTPKEESKELERKVDSYSSSFPKDVALLWKKYAKSKPIVMKKYLAEYRRNCIARIIKEYKITNEDLERMFKEEVEKFE